jgi:hypothetical protein
LEKRGSSCFALAQVIAIDFVSIETINNPYNNRQPTQPKKSTAAKSGPL